MQNKANLHFYRRERRVRREKIEIRNLCGLCELGGEKYELVLNAESGIELDMIMQNKPNFLSAHMNVNSLLARDYENKQVSRVQKNKANQTQCQKGGYCL